MTLGAPAAAATTPEAPPAARSFAMFGDPAVSAFYAARRGAPLWLADGPGSPAASELIQILKRSAAEGLYDGPGYAAQAEALIARAQNGDSSALFEADRLLSTGWVQYVQLLHRPPAGMIYAEQWVAPRRESASDILKLAAAARSPETYLRSTVAVNPIYAQLRDAAWSQLQATGSPPDPRVLASLDRVRAFPRSGRYVVVDTASARLCMVDDGRIADSMKVIVGKPTSQTPMLASTIYYATLNPYWHVPPDLVRTLIAHNVLEPGARLSEGPRLPVAGGLRRRPRVLRPATSTGRRSPTARPQVRVRQLPGPGNSMGHLKFGFANDAGHLPARHAEKGAVRAATTATSATAASGSRMRSGSAAGCSAAIPSTDSSRPGAACAAADAGADLRHLPDGPGDRRPADVRRRHLRPRFRRRELAALR